MKEFSWWTRHLNALQSQYAAMNICKKHKEVSSLCEHTPQRAFNKFRKAWQDGSDHDIKKNAEGECKSKTSCTFCLFIKLRIINSHTMTYNNINVGIIRLLPHEFRHFLGPHIFFLTNRPSVHTKPNNSLTKTASFSKHSPDVGILNPQNGFANSCRRLKPDIFE